MSERFANLKKITDEPAARKLAAVHVKLKAPVSAPVSAPVDVVLTELAAKEAWVDVVKLLAIALPAREAVWWGCIAARDFVGEGNKNVPACLKAAEAWVFDPSEKNREATRVSLDNVYVDDETDLVATAAMYAPGNMGTGDLAQFPAPAGAVSSCIFGINMISLSKAADFDEHMQILIDRGVDIARGGNGQTKKADKEAIIGDAS